MRGLSFLRIGCPHRVCEGLQSAAEDQALQAVRFIDKNVSGIDLGLDEEFQSKISFSELIRGYATGLVAPYVMRGFLPVSAICVILDVIVPSPKGLTPGKWKQTATLCPLTGLLTTVS